ncbi:MAG: hypothetical protein U1F12_07335 [Pseudomonadales bacterium]
MVYQIIAVLLFILAIAAVTLSVKFLGNKKWIVGFVRGCLGFFLVATGVVTALAGKDIYSYKPASSDTNVVVTVSFRKKDANVYIAEMQEPSGAFNSREIEGQQWQLTARMLAWPPLMSYIGLRSGYRLENISGRFIELQLDKMVAQKTSEPLNASGLLDTWRILNDHPSIVPLLSAHLAALGFIPIADGAIYEVIPAGQNFTVNPVNDAAKNAMKSW